MTSPSGKNRVVVRGAGEMASGVIRTLFTAGFEVIALEQPAPVCVRRTVCFAEAVFAGEATVEEVTAVSVESAADIDAILAQRRIPIFVDPEANSVPRLKPLVVVDGRMRKSASDCSLDMAPIVIGLGPGFLAGKNCHAAVETNRGPDLGQVYYEGGPQAYTGVPAPVDGLTVERVLRSPTDGVLRAKCRIGQKITPGEIICEISGEKIKSPIAGVVRGLVRDGLAVRSGQKIGDIDPRGDPSRCFRISQKADKIGKGALDAILVLQTRP